jgi:hypothetical protein
LLAAESGPVGIKGEEAVTGALVLRFFLEARFLAGAFLHSSLWFALPQL